MSTVFMALSVLLLFDGNSVTQQKMSGSKAYEVEVYVGQQQLPRFSGSKTWINIQIDHSFPYTTGFEIECLNPNIEIMHSLSDRNLSLYFKNPITNAHVKVTKEDSESQMIKVVVGGLRNNDVTVFLSKHFKGRVLSSINPPDSEDTK